MVIGLSMREQAGETTADLMIDDPRVALVLAEISTEQFRRARHHDPTRAVNVGIMEQTMVGVAAGFAMEGFLPIVHTITPFLVERPLEQIKLDFGYQGLQGTFISVGGSYDYTAEGFTHHSPGDVQAMLTVPGDAGAGSRYGRRARPTAARQLRERTRHLYPTEHGDQRRDAGRDDRAAGGDPAWRPSHGDRGRSDARSDAGGGRGDGRDRALRDERGALRRRRARPGGGGRVTM